jgi:hemolysin activation/secretion protein
MLIASVLLAAVYARAQTPRFEQDPAQRLLQEQRDRERQRELEQPPPQITVTKPPPAVLAEEADIESLAETGAVFRIDRISLVGNTILSPAEVERVTGRFIGKPLGGNRINLLLRRFTEAFVARGLITTRAYLGEQNLRSGTLVVTFVPGTIEAIQLNGQALSPPDPQDGGWMSDIGMRWAMPAAPGDVLNLTDLEQGVEQINRMRRNKAELQILPGTTPGGSIIGLANQAGDPFWFSAGVDNYGSRQTGLNRTRLGVEADNLLGFQEVLSFNYSGSRETNALVASAAVPFGYNTLSYTASVSEYQSLIGDTALLYGSTVASTWGWNRVLARSQSTKTAFDATLSLRRAEREINNIPLDPQQLSVLRIGVNTLRRFLVRQQPANWTLDVGVSKGLNAFGANRDGAQIQAAEAHSQFTKFDIGSTLTLPLFSAAGAMFSLKSQINGQWSNVALFGSEQLFVGGMSTVRGYREGGLSGDRGAYLRNEIIWSNAPQLSEIRIEPYAFFDIGAAELIAEQRFRQLSGAGLGVRLQAQLGKHGFSSEITLGRPLRQPDYFEPKSTLLLATLNWSY